MTGPAVARGHTAVQPSAGEPAALLVDRVSWHVGGARIVDDVTLRVAPGEFLALIGPNGAGKTSLFNLISGLTRPTSGRVLLAGTDVTRARPHQRARRGLGRTFQASAVFGSLSVAENVALAVHARRGSAARPWRSRADRAVADTAARILAETGLDGRAGQVASSLAHGEKRKLEIALVLAGSPRMLLLDEPMAGVSAEDVPALVGTVKALTAGTGRSVLMVEHHMDVVLELADRVAVLHHGALLACDTPAAVMADAGVQEAYLGEAL
jgi:branched-chain amino acid transport system ATP-binding protein